jgi:hypothetical protein
MLALTALTGFAAGARTLAVVLASNRTDYDLAADLQTGHGWDGVAPVNVTVTVNPGVIVNASATGTYAFDIALPAGSQVTLVNHGLIAGKGGAGGNADGGAGEAGGTALSTTVPTVVDNHGTIAGGGGGGGAGGGGSHWCSQGEDNYSCSVQGGGGGGGAGLGAGGSGVNNGGAGSQGTPGTGGGGGNCASGCAAAWSGAGGNGGGLGEGGTPGSAGMSGGGGSAGAAGPYLAGASQVTWITIGDLRGPST